MNELAQSFVAAGGTPMAAFLIIGGAGVLLMGAMLFTFMLQDDYRRSFKGRMAAQKAAARRYAKGRKAARASYR
jgi:hypothetical protein